MAVCVTVSIGGTCGKAVHTQDGSSYVRRADEMLYQAKQAGRNRYIYAPLQKGEPLTCEAPADYGGNLCNALASIIMMPVLSAGHMEDAAKAICEVGCRALNAHRVGVWLVDMDEKCLQSVACYGRAANEYFAQNDFDLSARAQYLSLLDTKRLLVIHDMRQPNPLAGIVEEYAPNVCALLAAPIRIRGRLAGVVCIEQDHCEKYPEKREWRVEEQSFASSLADLMTLAITNTGRSAREVLTSPQLI